MAKRKDHSGIVIVTIIAVIALVAMLLLKGGPTGAAVTEVEQCVFTLSECTGDYISLTGSAEGFGHTAERTTALFGLPGNTECQGVIISCPEKGIAKGSIIRQNMLNSGKEMIQIRIEEGIAPAFLK